MRNGLINGTKCKSSEQNRNLFQLLCIAHKTNGSCVMKRSLSLSDTKWKQYIEFLKHYLGMEEWFHDSNNKKELINARPQIAKVLWLFEHFFPRNTNTNGYNLPKMHGITKMWEYVMLFGSGINFYGGLGWEFQFSVPISGTPIGSGIPIPFSIPKIPVGFFFSNSAVEKWRNRNSDSENWNSEKNKRKNLIHLISHVMPIG